MKSALIKILMMLVCVCLALCLFACNGDTPDNGDNTDGGNTDGGNTDGGNTDGEIDWDNTGLEGLALIYNGKARFQVVYTAESGAKALELAQSLVDRLRELKIEVEDPVPDTDAAMVSDCEIIIGLNAQNRDGELNIGYRDLGPDGYAIKTVGTRIVVAGGSDARLESTWRNYMRDQMGIKSSTKKLTDLSVPTDYSVVEATDYDIDYVRVGTEDFSSYALFIDVSGVRYSTASVNSFREDLFAATGYWLEQADGADPDPTQRKLVIRYTDEISSEYEEYGFAAYVDENCDLIVECSYPNALDGHFSRFASSQIFDKMGGVTFASDYTYTSYASRAYYSEFGAEGDGATDDYQAMYDAHVYANQCGQTVYADAGRSYYVHVFHNGEIPVMTDVCLGDATIIIDDRGNDVYAQRGLALYKLVKDNPMIVYQKHEIESIFGKVSVGVGDTAMPWLASELVTDSMIRLTNFNHKDYVRYGGALEDSGYDRTDAVLVDAAGNIDPSTPVVFDFDEITEIRVIRTDDKPIVFDGGNFISICCRTVAETDFRNRYDAYARGISVLRTNAVVQNITHRMQDEPPLNTEAGKWGDFGESYPYHAFLVYDQTYNSKARNMDLTGHTTYYSSSGIAMGSYDIVLSYGIDIEFSGIVQTGIEIADQKYWGIMASNGVKNIDFTDCEISRFDAHRGFWNGSLTNVTLGHSFNVIGGGDLRATNVTKLTGYWFIHLRQDYGATFEGDMYLVNCTMAGYADYNSNQGGKYEKTVAYGEGQLINTGYNASDEAYLKWNFGYTCYMPKSLYIDNFSSGIKNVYVYNDILDSAFSDDLANKYVITSRITYRNMHNLVTVKQDPLACMKLASVPTVNETYPEESTFRAD